MNRYERTFHHGHARPGAHGIVLLPNGTLRFPHSRAEFRAMMAAHALGGKLVCQCVTRLLRWRLVIDGKSQANGRSALVSLPACFRAWLLDALDRQGQRRTDRRLRSLVDRASPLAERLAYFKAGRRDAYSITPRPVSKRPPATHQAHGEPVG